MEIIGQLNQFDSYRWVRGLEAAAAVNQMDDKIRDQLCDQLSAEIDIQLRKVFQESHFFSQLRSRFGDQLNDQLDRDLR